MNDYGDPPGLSSYLIKCSKCGHVAVYYADAITCNVKCERHIDARMGIDQRGCEQMITLARPYSIRVRWKRA